MLSENIKKYNELQTKKEELEKELNKLKSSIITEMAESNKDSITTSDGITVTVTVRENIKYSDELSMIKYFKDNGLGRFISEKLNTTLVNKELKKNASVSKDLADSYSISLTKYLLVK